jgi:hypothetical protein
MMVGGVIAIADADRRRPTWLDFVAVAAGGGACETFGFNLAPK